MTRTSVLALGLAVVAARAASGQVVQETQTTQAPNGAITQTTTTTAAGPGALAGPRRMSQIIGSEVRLQGANNFGRVEDVVLDPNGNIGYLVVGRGGQHAMLPWNAARFDYGRRVATYDVAPQAVQPLFFAPGAWPNLNDQQYAGRLGSVFPNVGPVNRATLRPVEGAVPGVVGGPVIEEREKIKRDGEVKVKERIR